MKMRLNKSEKIINKVNNKQLSSKRFYFFLILIFTIISLNFNFIFQKENCLCDINFINLFFDNETYFSKNDKSSSIIVHYVKNF